LKHPVFNPEITLIRDQVLTNVGDTALKVTFTKVDQNLTLVQHNFRTNYLQNG